MRMTERRLRSVIRQVIAEDGYERSNRGASLEPGAQGQLEPIGSGHMNYDDDTAIIQDLWQLDPSEREAELHRMTRGFDPDRIEYIRARMHGNG
jgi:hypothetical protein